jgi:phosphoribosylaminoimidazole-succinocarboxamide synthase
MLTLFILLDTFIQFYLYSSIMSEQPYSVIELAIQQKLSTQLEIIPAIKQPAVEMLQGSSKEIHLFMLPDGRKFAIFLNSDRISVFDAKSFLNQESGGKGAVAAAMTAAIFEHLERKGKSTHLIGIMGDIEGGDGSVETCGFLSRDLSPSNKIAVHWVRRPELPRENNEYDYTEFAQAAKEAQFHGGEGTMLPIEVVCRYSVIPGVSSCTKSQDRFEAFLEQNNLTYEDLNECNPNVTILSYESIQVLKGKLIRLPRPIIDPTTKYEVRDKPIDRETYHSAMMSLRAADDCPYSYDNVVAFSTEVCNLVRSYFLSLGIVIPDLKIELGIKQGGGLMVTDVIGPDEIRMFLLGDSEEPFDFSKQLFRNLYVETNWMQLLIDYQKAYGDDWKQYFRELDIPQPQLNANINSAVEAVNVTLLEVIRGFDSKERLAQAIANVRSIISDLRSTSKVFSGDISNEQYQSYQSQLPTSATQ